MALNYRSTGLYNRAGSTTAVVPAPTGLSDGDLIFVVICRASAVNPTSVPTGWTLVRSNLATYGYWLYYKIANGEGASWTWTWSGSSKTLGRSHAFYGGYDLNNPIQSSTTPYSGTTSGTAITIPALTTGQNDSLSIIFASGYSTSTKTFTVPTNWTEHNDSGNTSPDFWQAVASRNFPTSGTNTGTVSYPMNSNSTYRVGVQVLVNQMNLSPSTSLVEPIDGDNDQIAGPIFSFSGTDPDGDSVEYNIQIDTVNTFDSPSVLNKYSETDIGFSAGHPFSSGATINYTVQLVEKLTFGVQYYWRVRAKDPSGTNTYGDWSVTRTFTPARFLSYRSTGVYNSAGSTTAVVPAPSGLSNGDLIFVSIRRASAVEPTGVPSGWTLIQKNLATYGFWVYYKIANGEESSWTWNWSGSTRTLGHSFAFYGDYDVSNPIQNSTTPYSATASGTPVYIPALTTSQSDSLSIIIASGYSTSTKTFAVPTNWTEHSDTGNTSPDFWQAMASRSLPVNGTNTGIVSYPISAASTYRVGVQIFVNRQNNLPITSLLAPIDDYVTTDFRPTFSFSAEDLDNDSVDYHIEIDTSASFDSQSGNPLISAYSNTDSGFSIGSPYTSGVTIEYTLQSDLTYGIYYWRVSANNPNKGGIYGSWSETRAFVVKINKVHYVQRGSIDLGANTSVTVNLAIPVDTSKTWIKIWLGVGNSSSPDSIFVESYFPVLNQYVDSFRLDRYGAVTGITVYWQVISMDNISVQHINNVVFGAGNTIVSQPISPIVSLNKAFAFVSGRVNTTSGSLAHEGLFSSNITSTSNVNIVRGAGTSVGMASLQVVEFTDSTIVDHQSITVANMQTDTTLAGSVDISSAFTIFTYHASAGTLNINPIIELTSSTNLQIRRGAVNNTTYVEAYVISLTDTRKELDAGDNITSTVTVVPTSIIRDIDYAFTVFSLTNSGTGTTWANQLAAATITDTNTNTIYKNNTNNTTAWSLQTVQLPMPPNYAPSIILNNPVADEAIPSVSGVFSFTGTDIESDLIEYQIEIDTANTFDSQSGLPYIRAASDVDLGFTSGHPFVSGLTVEYTIQTVLASGNYYWRVRGIDPLGGKLFGNWSEIRAFTVNDSPTVALSSPINLYQTSNNLPTFSFIGVDPELNQVEFNFQFDTSDNFDSQSGSPILSVSSSTDSGFTSGHPYDTGATIEYIIQSGLSLGVYYWRVSAIDPLGSNKYGAWSEVRSIEITPNLSASVALNAPLDLATGQITNPVLYFTGTDPENNSLEYQVQIDTVATFDSDNSGAGNTAYTNSFEINDWTSVLVAGSNASWTRAASSTRPTGITPNNGSNIAIFNSYTCQANAQARFYAGTTFNLPLNAVLANLNFWIYHDTGYSSSDDRVQLQISTNGGTDWSNVGVAASRYDGTTGWSEVSVDISSYIGSTNILIGFLGISGYGNNCHIDNVVCSYDLPAMPLINRVSSSDVGFSSGHPYSSGSEVNYTIQSSETLTESLVYYWRARAIDPSGSNSYGNWSSVYSFGVGNIPPVVTMNFPNEGEMVSTTPSVYFVGIDAELDRVEYNVQIDTASTFDSQSGSPLISAFSISDVGFSSGHPYESGYEVSYTTQIVLALGTYYWRVSAIDPLGRNIYGDWSLYQSFQVVSNAPPSVVLISPKNLAMGVPKNPNLRFIGTDPEGDNIEYEIQVDTVNTFDSNGGGSESVAMTNSFEAANWTSVLVSGSNASWTRATTSSRPAGISPNDGSNIAIFNSYTCQANAQARFYSSSTFSIPSNAGSATLTYWVYHDTGYPASNDRVQPQISRNSGSSWTSVGSATSRYNGNTGWEIASVNVTNYIGGTNLMIGFLGISGYGNDCHIDNVAISYDLPLISKRSATDIGFNPGSPFVSGASASYDVQSADTLTDGVTYYWRVRSIDPLGRNAYGMWSSIYSFIPNTGMKVWDGSSWTYKPLKVWDGSSWIAKPIKHWDGNEWVIKG